MHVQRITDLTQWESLVQRWNTLARSNPFSSWEWLSTWWRHYGLGHELCVLAVMDTRNEVVGLVPWYLQRTSTRGHVLQWLGSGEVCSDYLTVLCEEPDAPLVIDAVVQWLLTTEESQANGVRWDLILLESVPENDQVVRGLTNRLVEAGCSLTLRPNGSCWKLDLPTTFEEYLARLSKSHRKQVNRLLRENIETGRAQLTTATTSDELARLMDVLIELHTRRWRSQGQGGVFASECFTSFLREVAGKLLAAGKLEVVTLELNGRPAAVDFHLLSDDGHFVYQGGIEPELTDESPGRLLTACLIRHAIESGRGRFDFLRGDEPYKSHFRAEGIPTHDLHVVPPRAMPQIRHGLWRAGLTMKDLVKSHLFQTGNH